MIKVYCKEEDEYKFENCLSYTMSGKICANYDNECDDCPYLNRNIQFVQHDIDKIIIETDEVDLDIKTCLYRTFYNFHKCGMVDISKGEDCENCRFWYENIEIKNLSQPYNKED